MPRRLTAVLALALALAAGCNGTPSVNQGVVRDVSGNEATLGAHPNQPVPATTTVAKPPPTWGQRYAWDNGLAIEVSPPAVCKPSKYASPQGIKRAVKVTIKIINGSTEPVDSVLFTFGNEAQFNGHSAETIFDINGPCAGTTASTTILAGKTFTTALAFAVDPGTGELQLSFEPHLGSDKAVYVGQA